MEDEYVILDNSTIRRLVPGIPGKQRLAFFGVYDGHGGKNVGMAAPAPCLSAPLNPGPSTVPCRPSS